jgi:hypothetical protein
VEIEALRGRQRSTSAGLEMEPKPGYAVGEPGALEPAKHCIGAPHKTCYDEFMNTRRPSFFSYYFWWFSMPSAEKGQCSR